MHYLYFFGALALLVLIWGVCRTPEGPQRDAETQRAKKLADRGRAQALFGHPHHPGNGEEPTE